MLKTVLIPEQNPGVRGFDYLTNNVNPLTGFLKTGYGVVRTAGINANHHTDTTVKGTIHFYFLDISAFL